MAMDAANNISRLFGDWSADISGLQPKEQAFGFGIRAKVGYLWIIAIEENGCRLRQLSSIVLSARATE